MENQITQQDPNEVIVTLNLSIGEWNGIFGVINSGAFQGVMIEVAQSVNNQIRGYNIPASQSQQEALLTVVPVQLQVGVVNSILGILNGNTGFITVMQPIIDKITAQAQSQIQTVPTETMAAPNALPNLTLPPH